MLTSDITQCGRWLREVNAQVHYVYGCESVSHPGHMDISGVIDPVVRSSLMSSPSADTGEHRTLGASWFSYCVQSNWDQTHNS